MPHLPSRDDLVVVRVDAVRDPRPVGDPADLLELLDRPPPERLQAVRVLVGVLGEVGVQADVEPLRELGRRRISSGVTENGEHGASAMRTIAPHDGSWCSSDQPLAVGEDLVVVLHDGIGREPAVLLRHGSSSRGSGGTACPARAPPRSRRRRGRRRRAGARTGDRSSWCSRRARARPARPRPTRTRPPRRAAPTRVQRGQPLEQRAVDRGPVAAGEVLVDVMVGVDQPRRHQAAGRVRSSGGGRRRVGRRADPADQAVGDRDPPAGQLPPLVVDGGDELRAGHQQVGGRRGLRHWRLAARTGPAPPTRGSRSRCTAAPTRRSAAPPTPRCPRS